MDRLNPKTLIFALSTKASYRPVLYSEDEVFCSPDEVVQRRDNRYVTLKTPVGSFDVSTALACLPPEQLPELLVVKLDASNRLVPRGLDKLRCPKVLILGDTHHFESPIRYLLEYAQSEAFDLIVTDHDRHHLHWFDRAGVGDAHWLPGLNFNLRQRPIAPPSQQGSVFVGQTGNHHPYRRELFRALEARGLPVRVGTALPEVAADLYASHAITLNCSLNGDLNLRVFETLGSGAFLLTDRLSPDSGLGMIFEDGKDLVLYSGAEDLAEKIKYYLDHPAEAMEIRRRGHERLLAEHHPDLKRQQLMELVFSGQENPAFSLRDGRFRRLAALERSALPRDLPAYEFLQQRHLRALRLVLYGEAGSITFAEDLSRLVYRDLERRCEDLPEDLPAGLEEERFLILATEDSEEIVSLVEGFVGDYIFDLALGSHVADLLARYGFDGVEGRPGMYSLTQPLMAALRFAERGAARAAAGQLGRVDLSQLDLESLFAYANIAANLGDLAACERALEGCLAIDRSQVEVYLSLSDVHLAREEYAGALICLHEAKRFSDPLPDPHDKKYRRLREEEGRMGDRVADYFDRVRVSGSASVLPPRSRILVYTNLLPPQELGGYGRKMWEFAYELSLRGHEIRILAGDAPYLWKEAEGEEMALEPQVSRSLRLFGEWTDGKITLLEDRNEIVRIMRENAFTLSQEIGTFRPDFCLMGNIDLIGHLALPELEREGVPCVQCMGNQVPGWPADFQPNYDVYAAGPASAFLSGLMEGNGFHFKRSAVLYPGARIDRFYRPFLPRLDMPRIVFAGLLMPYKGAHTLIAALETLKIGGIEFRATIAGDSTSQSYVQSLKDRVELAGMGDWIEFPGFLDRSQLAAVFCRHNLLVFPSICDEAFGISQVEALASGLTVITSGRGGCCEIIRDGQDGLVFECDNPIDLAKKIASLIADPERWERLSRAGRERSLAFAIPQTVDRIEALFLELGRIPRGCVSGEEL